MRKTVEGHTTFGKCLQAKGGGDLSNEDGDCRLGKSRKVSKILQRKLRNYEDSMKRYPCAQSRVIGVR